jgi:hypothetical protein
VTSVPWVWDDNSVPTDSNLLRRVPRKPSCVVTDPATSQAILKHEAFTYDHGSGMSASLEHALAGGAARDVVEWTTHALAVFTVAIVRSSVSGVVRCPMEEDHSHGLVRVAGDPEGPAARRVHWLPLRSRIREAARYVDSPDDLEKALAR